MSLSTIPNIDSPFAWVALVIFVTAALGADFMMLRQQGSRVIRFKDALRWSLIWIALALVFCAGLWFALDLSEGRALADLKAGEFLTGYIIEKSLSVDNLFVFLMLFNAFKVPLAQQKKALMIGIIAAIVLRIALILVGAWLISRLVSRAAPIASSSDTLPESDISEVPAIAATLTDAAVAAEAGAKEACAGATGLSL